MARGRSRHRRGELERVGPGRFELADEEKDWMQVALVGDPANRDVYAPRAEQRVPTAGAWCIIVRRLPAIEGRIDLNFKVGRVFYLEHEASADAEGFRPDGMYKVVCHSPWGDLHLWPYEYSTLPTETVVSLWADGELVFHPTNIDAARFSSVAFYARSRGIGLADAAVMALGTLTGPVGYFEPRADLAETCELMEARVHRNFSRHLEDLFT